ncbi:MAG: PD-(D/E)XK nuclease family protein [Comamonadaceae bacterium]|nr:PD-(D/E)XK nuclease family protein [Comamonadaceae bacterium]
MTALISQSEVDQFLSCSRKHYYAFGEKLQPRHFGQGLARGLLGHLVLDAYYSQFIRTRTSIGLRASSVEDVQTALSVMNQPEYLSDPVLLLELRILLEDYFRFYDGELNEWEVLAVEQEFRLDNEFPFKPDMIKRHRTTGKVLVVDHKFLYNFYSDSAIDIMPQLAKYVGALRKIGFQVDGAEYNMLRHRKNATQKFKRVEVTFTDKKIDTFLKEQKIVAEKIREFRKLPLDEWRASVYRTASSFNCQHCSFLALCSTDLNGYNGRDLLVRTSYEPNTYGYLSDVEGEIVE